MKRTKKEVHVGCGFYVPEGTECPLWCGMPFHVGLRHFDSEGGGKSSIGCGGLEGRQAVRYLQTERLIAAIEALTASNRKRKAST